MLYVLPWGLYLAQNVKIPELGIFGGFNTFGVVLNIYLPFGGPKLKTTQRVGPHNIDLISVLMGNMLGDGHGELRSGAPRFSQHMSSKNREYLNWLHKFYSIRGYTSTLNVQFKSQIGQKGKIYFSGKFNTYTFISLKWLYDLWYKDNIKILPQNIEYWLTPQCQAIWFMDDGGIYNKGILFSTYNFTQNEHNILKKSLYSRYNLKSTILRRPAGYILVIQKEEQSKFIHIVKPFMIPSMLYKQNDITQS